MKHQPSSLDTIAAHVIESLPDSMIARRRLLEALEALLPERHAQKRELSLLLCDLNRHELRQRELPLLFLGQDEAKHNGKGAR